MKKANYTIILPENTDVESVVIKVKRKGKKSDQIDCLKDIKRRTFVEKKCADREEPEEGFLFDELY